MHTAVLQGNIPEQEQGQERKSEVARPEAEEQECQAATQRPNLHDQRYRCRIFVKTRFVCSILR
jgi:hypothetical protein